jgi:hypothetical protein
LPALLIGSLVDAGAKVRAAKVRATEKRAARARTKDERGEVLAPARPRPRVESTRPATAPSKVDVGRRQSRAVILFLVLALGVPFFTMGTTRPAVAAGSISYGGNIGTTVTSCSSPTSLVSANEDAELHEEDGATSYGGSPTLSVNASTSDAVHRSVVKFPLPAQPAGCEILSAELRLRTNVEAAGRSIAVTRLADPWTEATVAWHSQPASTGPSVVRATSSGWMDWNVTSQVLAMYAGANHGFRISDASEVSANASHTFRSSETADPPQLEITWGAASGTTTALSTTQSVPQGRSVVLSFAMDDDGAGPVSASDSAGNTYNVDADSTASGEARSVILSAHGVDALPAGSTITVNHPSTDTRGLSANYFVGLSESTALDDASAATGTNSSPNTGSVSTTDPNELLVGAFGIASGTSFSAGSGFTSMPGVAGAGGRLATQYQIVSAAGSYSSTGTLGSSATWAGGLASYRMDTTLPVVQIDGPADGSLAPAMPTFSGDSGDENSDSDTVKVKLYSGPTASGTPVDVIDVTRDQNGSWTHDHITPLADGIYTAQAEQEDAAGNIGLSSPVTFTVDTLAPGPPSLISPSPDPGNDTSVTWQFGGEPGGTYECQLAKDSVALVPFAACTPPDVSYALTDGDGIYTFSVRQTDVAGNVGPESSDDYVLDTQTPSDPVITGPNPNLGNNPNIVWSFTSEPGALTECRLMKGVQMISDFTDCTSPANHTLVDGDGTYTFSVRQTDRAGNPSGIASHDHTLDTDAPATSLDAGPSALTNSPDASFDFSSDDPTATFECDFDGAGFTPCSSPTTYASLGDGNHFFAVRAVDGAGNLDASPELRSFTVDTGAPPISIDDGPTDPGNLTSVAWQFSSEPSAFLECELSFEGSVVSGFADCSSGSASYGLGADGLYTFTVRATDPAGNVSSASDTYLLDTTRPDSVATSVSLTSATTFTVGYSVQESGAGAAEVELWANTPGGAGWTLAATDTSMSGSFSYSAVDGDGTYSFYTRVRDAAGNYEDAPGAFDTETVVDTAAPSLALSTAPADPNTDPMLTFTFSSTDPTASFVCSLTTDGSDAYAPCASPASYPAPAATTTYTFKVVASDAAGNASAPSTWTFTWVEPAPEPTPTPTETITPTPSETITPTPTETITPTPTETVTPTPTETVEPTPTVEPPTTPPPPPPPTEVPPTGGGAVTVDKPDKPAPVAREPKPKKDPPRKEPAPKPAPEIKVPAPSERTVPNRIAELARLAAETAKTFAFPLLLAILVIVFLLVQHWIDKKDPKLAMAPVHSNHDLARFG